MSSEKGIVLKVDPQKRIGIDDVIEMLKGLRDETFFDVVRTSEKNIEECSDKKKTSLFNKDKKTKSNNVIGNTDLPQIRELNDIAALLRSMDTEKNELGN